MKELMEWLYSKLSVIGNVYFEDLERNKEGKAIMDDIKIVYNIPNVLQLTDNRTRNDIPLIIDVWGRNNQVLQIENIVEKIELLQDEVYRKDKLFFIVQKDNLFRNNLKDEDKNIRRVELHFIIRKFK
ncbi:MULTISPECIES: hypothetical protein [Clostridium]|uniref:hypothetical protein n=1 Tax=Clostridium TaxID=1485 RepID=UPI000E057495|nr:hypothetical protein [Clostridium sporogenes]MCW6085579.1 hypothetical protein [Clostridium sporogenes]STC76670.1 Uncharacterised protein [Clostridium botulinum]